LYNFLEKLKVEPQLYGLRWIRLLFGREFHFEDALCIWDAIFADSGGLKQLKDEYGFTMLDFSLVEHISFVMLINLRRQSMLFL